MNKTKRIPRPWLRLIIVGALALTVSTASLFAQQKKPTFSSSSGTTSATETLAPITVE